MLLVSNLIMVHRILLLRKTIFNILRKTLVRMILYFLQLGKSFNEKYIQTREEYVEERNTVNSSVSAG